MTLPLFHPASSLPGSADTAAEDLLPVSAPHGIGEQGATSCTPGTSRPGSVATGVEEWRPVPGWPYEVSNLGRVRRAGSARPLAPGVSPKGYELVCLCRDGQCKSVRVHVLVAAAFLGPRPRGYHINHKDANPRHNAATNLEYVTPRENIRDVVARRGRFTTAERQVRGESCASARLNDDGVRALRHRHAAGATIRDLAREAGLSQTAVREAIHGGTWQHITDVPPVPIRFPRPARGPCEAAGCGVQRAAWRARARRRLCELHRNRLRSGVAVELNDTASPPETP